jgi:hypothetical protein
MAATDGRRYEMAAGSTDVFARVLGSSRAHHVVVHDPMQNGCPGEHVTPAQSFLAGVASCGDELIHVLARARGVRFGVCDRRSRPRSIRIEPRARISPSCVRASLRAGRRAGRSGRAARQGLHVPLTAVRQHRGRDQDLTVDISVTD